LSIRNLLRQKFAGSVQKLHFSTTTMFQHRMPLRTPLGAYRA